MRRSIQSNLGALIQQFVLMMLLACALSAEPMRSLGRINPKAPPETAQFSFIIGAWDCMIRSMKPDGSGFTERQASWTGYYILDGWAIQDIWVYKTPDGQTYEGTNVHSFNPETSKWDNRWVASPSLQWKYFQSEMVGDTMVMTGGEGKGPNGDFIDRNTFFDIAADSWSWRKDRSFDGGETWIEGVAFIEAMRAN
jgi:hypothetical protein